MSDRNYVILDGIAYFSNLFKPGERYGGYDICIGQLSDETVEELTNLGVGSKLRKSDPKHLKSLKEQGKQATDMGNYITVRSSSKEYFTVTDPEKNPVTSLPFGSKVRVMAVVRPNKNDASKMVINLTTVIVLEAAAEEPKVDPYAGLPSDSQPDNEKPWNKDEAREKSE